MPAGLAVSPDGYTLDLRTPVVEASRRGRAGTRDRGARRSSGHRLHDRARQGAAPRRSSAATSPATPTSTRHATPTACGPSRRRRCRPARTGCSPTSSRPAATASPWAPTSPSPATTGPSPLPAPSDRRSVDGFDVSFDGELVAGTESELTVTVTRDGEPVTDLQPYLGALGHLVAIRDGDLAYLHVHPLDEADGVGRAAGAVRRRGADRRHLRAVLRLLPRRRGPHRDDHRRPPTTASATHRTAPTRHRASHDSHGG